VPFPKHPAPRQISYTPEYNLISMRAFKISLNGKKLCLAGVENRGIVSAIVDCVAQAGGERLSLHVGGLANEEHLKWTRIKRLRVGDEIRVKIVEAASADCPTERKPIDPTETLKAKKRYVRMIAKELGWKIESQVK
jgi:hypothetical protein